MNRLLFLLSILLLIIAGSWLRFGDSGWSKVKVPNNSSIRLEAKEAEWDKTTRVLLQLRDNPPVVAAFSYAKRSDYEWGYPRFLAVCYTLFGYGDTPPLIEIYRIQNVLEIMTGLLLYAGVFLLLNQIFLAWTVAALYMLQPVLRSASALLEADTLNTFVQAGALICMLLFFRGGERSPFTGLICGTVFGMGILVYPPLLPFFLLFIGLAGIRCFYTRRNVPPYLLAILSCILILSPWWMFAWQHKPEHIVIANLT